jgi:hypothetical protein
MTLSRITELDTFLNNQREEQENLSDYLSQTKALIQVALNEEFLAQTENTINNYIWVLFDLVVRTQELNDKLLEQLSSFHIK